MRFNVNLNLSGQTIPQKIENGRAYILAMTNNPYFMAPNAEPHPKLAEFIAIVAALELAFNQSINGGKHFTQALRLAEANYDNAVTDLAAYVTAQANANPVMGEAIIISAGMVPRRKGAKNAPGFYVRNTALSGEVKGGVKAQTGAIYIWEMSVDPATNGGAYAWQQVEIGKRATIKVGHLTPGQRTWFRVALIIKGQQQEWSSPESVLVN